MTLDPFFFVFLTVCLLLCFFPLFTWLHKKYSRKHKDEALSFLQPCPDMQDLYDQNNRTTPMNGGDKRKRVPLPKPNNHIRVVDQSDESARYMCGHDNPTWYTLNIYGIVSKRKGVQHGDVCPDCLIEDLRQYVARCSCCGLPIQSGDAVMVYHEADSRLKYKHVSVRIDDSYFIGCMRDQCCPTRDSFAGYWIQGEFRPTFDRE